MAKRKGVLTGFPEDFRVTPRMMELALENGWDDPRTQVAAFRDSCLANGKQYADWEAAFRTWLRNRKEWGKAKPMPVPKAPRQAQPELKPEKRAFEPRVSPLLQDLIEKFDVRKKA